MPKFRHVALLLILLLTACRPGLRSHQVHIRADGQDIDLTTSALTVREALSEAGVAVGPDDLVRPDLWVQITDGLSIRVIRVQEEVIVERETIPYTQQTIKSEALPVGEQKLLQTGKNGEAQVTWRLRFEDGVEISRSVLQRIVIVEAADQIIAVGIEGVVESVEIPGVIAYLNSGNAWIMRGQSGGRRAVTSDGALDGRVLALSPDGAYLLYSVALDSPLDGPLNELFLLNVRLINEISQSLKIQNVLWADWSPDGRQIAYSTGVKSGPPGWNAHNDLWMLTVRNAQGDLARGQPQRVLAAQTTSLYSWQGTLYAWSPDGSKMAYARADEIGWIDLSTRRGFPLASFVPPEIERERVWLSPPSWSPDSQYVLGVVHGQAAAGQPAASSDMFEVWAFSLNRQVRARLVSPSGMWAMPRWSPLVGSDSLIAYAQAEYPQVSFESRYVLYVMDRDGSNRRVLFPAQSVGGLLSPAIQPPPRYAWSPDARYLAVIYAGNLYLVDSATGQARQLTGDGQSRLVDWEK